MIKLTKKIINHNINLITGGPGGSDRHKRKSWKASTCQPVAPQGTTPHGYSGRLQEGTDFHNAYSL